MLLRSRSARARHAWWLALLLPLTVAVCDRADYGPSAPPDPPEPPRPVAAVVPPPAATVRVPVQVPSAMRSAPFDVARSLVVPPGFSVAVYARVARARFLAVAPNGDLFVSQPSTGKVLLLRPGSDGPVAHDWASGLRQPHDMVFHAIGGTTHLYIAESHQVSRYVYAAGATTAPAKQVVVANLPDASTPELRGAYGHELKNIALGPDHALYVSIASTCNACLSDTESDPVRGAIYRYDADGRNGRLFARGLRNAEGLAFVPGTNLLWAVVNNRDNIAYPFHHDWNGDGDDDYGKVMPSYVDDHPPEEFTRVRDGGNYGWPFCNPNPDTPNGYDDMPYDRDVQYNASGSRLDCATADRISKGIQAHSAPLGLTFLQGTPVPAAYRTGAVVALHGSWNRSTKTGYRIAYFPWDAAVGRPGPEQDLVAGWLTGGSVWGRPVDAAVAADGALFISDDRSGTIYRLTADAVQPTPQAVTRFALIDAAADRAIAGYGSLADSVVLDLAALPARRLTVEAKTTPTAVGSVRFAYDGRSAYRTENRAPYVLAADERESDGSIDYLSWTPTVGWHGLRATPYTSTGARGTAGTAHAIAFAVADRLEGEAATLGGGAKVTARYPGFTGSGYLDFGLAAGEYGEWRVAAMTGTYTLEFRYAHYPRTARTAQLVVNGAPAGRLTFASTGGWSRWRALRTTVALREGTNSIRLTVERNGNGTNVDHVRVLPAAVRE